MRTKSVALAFLLLLATSILSAAASQTKTPDQLPAGALFSAEELSKKFSNHQFTPYGDAKFSLEILVPTGWESHLSDYDPGQLTHDTEAAVPMVEFYPNGADDLGVNVQYIREPGAKPVGEFIEAYVKKANGTVAARQQLNL
jgi:hypothetical protein